ncbi:hypothetical protein GWI33_020349 [Rhynchophorus ferrugineus]|uniref:Anoctamin n=1 Tax=Rhynchophorus ferrugineus TaxID=354439 RepID=A0A834LZJ1_RHYFE|nr:hypothetical protein GWI33_020349 [Rhynchophorus ferrugineus]
MGYTSGMKLTDEETQLPPTYVVMKVAADIHEMALQWLIGKVRAKKYDGGGELVVMMEEKFTASEEYTFHISATKYKLLEIAEELNLMKKDVTGHTREFTLAQLNDFLYDDMTIDDLLTLTDKQTIVIHELENIRALNTDTFIPGYPLFKLYDNQAIIPFALNRSLITKVYPLHDDEELKKLSGSWYMSGHATLTQPIDDIKQYFGECITMYFAFLEYYTRFLIVPVILGLLGSICSETVPFFCIFNIIWVTLFLELWKKKASELAFKWGTIEMTSLDEPRPGFRGIMGIDAVTGKVCPQSPRYMTYIKMYACSFPIVVLCMLAGFYLMLWSLWSENYVKDIVGPDSYIVCGPGIVYTVIVYVISVYFRSLATYLTEWENHRTQSQFDRHRVTKLVLFEFVNNFSALIYIAFVMKDMEMLWCQLKTQMITNQIVTNLVEVFMPLGMNHLTKKTQKLKRRASFESESKRATEKVTERSFPLLNIPQLPVDDSRIIQAHSNGNMEEYEDTFDDYLELYIQFGFVFLFSSVYPMAALWAFLNNIVEIRADAFKLCKVFRRPATRKVKDIGAWQRSFEVLGGLSILTNCGVLYLSPDTRRHFIDWSEIELLLLFMCLQQLLIGVRYVLHISISDKPEWVRVALAKKNYQLKQAMKFERSQMSKKILQRYRTVHGTPNKGKLIS